MLRPTLTPTPPIRAPGEVPDSQDDNEGYSSDFEDLLEESQGGEVELMQKKTKAETEKSVEPATQTLPAPARPTSKPLPTHPPAPSSQPPDTVDPGPMPESKHVTLSPSLPPPSTAAHTLLLTRPPVTDTAHRSQPTAPDPTTAAHTRLLSSITSLHSQISHLTLSLSHSNALLVSQNINPSLAPTIVKNHITLLHEYNAIKDVGLGLMGMIAEGRGVRVGGVMQELGVGEKD